VKTRAAVLWGVGQQWQVEEIELDPPKAGEVLVKYHAAGLCHSDEHLVTGDLVMPDEAIKELGLQVFPMVGGHEGAGVVVEVGPGVTRLQPGDHVAASFIPACGRCRWCVTGRSALCDLGAYAFAPGQISDFTSRHHCRGHDLNTMAKLGTFSEHSVVNEASLVKVDADLPFPAVALVSCGVATGWGSAVHRAGVRPGEVVVVVGVGGVGINAVQGARMAGARVIVAVDPVEFKQKAALDFGATHSVASIDEAVPLVTELTTGQMAERVILTPSVLEGHMIAGGLSLTGKDGTCVCTAMAPFSAASAEIRLAEFVLWNKELKGVLFGSGNPQVDIPNLLALYRAGQLKLDELVTRTYTLDQVNEGYEDMRQGKNLRGVIVFD
jgi:NDMA-dependent alcohol dehydrogenase